MIRTLLAFATRNAGLDELGASRGERGGIGAAHDDPHPLSHLEASRSNGTCGGCARSIINQK